MNQSIGFAPSQSRAPKGFGAGDYVSQAADEEPGSARAAHLRARAPHPAAVSANQVHEFRTATAYRETRDGTWFGSRRQPCERETRTRPPSARTRFTSFEPTRPPTNPRTRFKTRTWFGSLVQP